MSKAVKVAVWIIMLSILGPGSTRAENELAFEPAVVTISGRLLGDYVLLGSGAMVSGFILYLDEPVTIKGNPESADSKETVPGVQKILLELPKGVETDDLAGKSVTLEGSLFHSPSDPHHTEVLMKVTKVLQVSDQ